MKLLPDEVRAEDQGSVLHAIVAPDKVLITIQTWRRDQFCVTTDGSGPKR